MTTVLIVDDHAGFRRVARALLEESGFDVVGEAEDGTSAMQSVRRLAPGLVLLDVQLADTDGFAVAEALHHEPSPPAVVLVSSRPLTDYGDRVADSPALGFIPKADLSGPALSALLRSPPE